MIHHSLRTGVQWRPARRRMMEFVAVAALTALVVSTFSCRDRTPPTSEALPAVPVPQPALLPKSLSAFLGELKTTATPHTRAAILCSQARLVPSVFLIGGTKTGTTAMFHSLRKSVSFLHSGVPIDGENEWAAKEKFFWNLKYHKGRQWYTLHFPGCPGVVHGAQSRVAGRWGVEMPEMGPDALPHAAIDLTANLFISPEAPARIKKAYGPMSRHLTFLFMMKHDPTQLVHSSIWMSFPQEHLPQTRASFARKARSQLAAAAECTSNGVEFMMPGHGVPVDADVRECMRKTHNLRQAAYAPMLSHWLSHFDAEQFVLISSESYFKDPDGVTNKVASQLGIPYSHTPANVQDSSFDTNLNAAKPSLRDEDPGVVRALADFFGEYQVQLEDLLVEHVLRRAKTSFVGDIEPFLHHHRDGT